MNGGGEMPNEIVCPKCLNRPTKERESREVIHMHEKTFCMRIRERYWTCYECGIKYKQRTLFSEIGLVKEDKLFKLEE